MIRKSADKAVHVREHVFDGENSITVRDLLSGPEEMNEKGRVFAHTTLMPGCSIGFHRHEKDAETYYILRGTADYSDNGTPATLQAGDVAYTPVGEGHSIANHGDEPLDFIALILYQ